MSTGYAFPTGVEDGHQVELENGVTYEFRAEFRRWDVVKGTGNSVWITDEPPDEQYTSNGDLWFDNTEDTMQLFLYHEESGAWMPVAPPTTLEGRVGAGEATQAAIIAQIQESLDDQAKIVAKVEELSITKGAVARYVVKGTEMNVATRNGELYVNSPNAADVAYISFAPFDSNGQATKPTNPDDIIEFVEAVGVKNAGEITRYKVVSGDSNALTVEYLSGNNNFEVGEVEEIYVYPQNQDLASIEYVDAQDNVLKGYVDYQVGETNDKVDEELEALKDYVDTEIGNLPDNDPVPVDDLMTLSGTQLVTPGNWRIQQNSAVKGLSSYISISDGALKLYHLQEPTADHHAASKGYVDNAISGGGAGGIILDLWTYKGTKNDGNDLNDGEFGSKKLANGVLEIFLANKNSRGVIYHPTPPNSTAEYSHQITESNQGGSPMTVMHQDGRCLWYAETKRIVFNKGSGNYIFIEAIKYRAAFDLLVEGDEYMLNVPGFLGPVAGW